jgi:ribosomal protein L35
VTLPFSHSSQSFRPPWPIDIGVGSHTKTQTKQQSQRRQQRTINVNTKAKMFFQPIIRSVPSSSSHYQQQTQKTFSSHAKSHSASKKRFKPKGNGGMVFKPSGRKHGMHRHSRNRNQQKGAAVVINRNENGDLWKRLRGMNLQMKGKKIQRPRKIPIKGTEIRYRFFSQEILQSKGLTSIVANEITTEMAPKFISSNSMAKLRPQQPPPVAKKVQWRVITA